MLSIPDVITRSMASFVGLFAPSLGKLAETCNALSRAVRKCYCRHCGRVFRGAFEIDQGRGRCAGLCDFPDELDPFRRVYPTVKWDHVVAAGGWPAFLHFREHLRYTNPWRAGGEIASRDLDLFWFGGGRSPAYAWQWTFKSDRHQTTPPLRILECLERPSQWNDYLKRMDTDIWANTKLALIPNDQDTPVLIVDAIGAHCRVQTAMNVLETFDLPYCMVGFQMINVVGFQFQEVTRCWILHPRHTTHAIAPDVPRTDKLASRLLKYAERGYNSARCDCRAEMPSCKKQKL